MSRASLVLWLLIALLILPVLAPHSLFEPVQNAHASPTTITLYADISGWNFSRPSGINPTIYVTQGDTVSFNLISEDTYSAHLLLLDFDRNGVTSDCSSGPDKCSGNIPVGGSSSISPFTVTANPGMYSYYCLYHSPTYMVGQLVVRSPGPDYGISASPSALTIIRGANANSTVSIASLNGFSGQVTLSATPPPSWSAPFFSVNPVTVSAGMTATSKLTIYVPAGASPGSYSVTVTASNSTTSHPTNVAITVPIPDFSITTSPTALTINSGASAPSTVNIAELNGFSGSVSLSAAVPPGRGTATLNPTSVTLSSTTTSATSTLTVSSALGAFNVTVTGASGGTSHSALVLVNGPDFTIKNTPASVSVGQASSSTLTITLSSINGFSGSVALQASSLGGPSVSVSPASVQVPPNGSVNATITVMVSSSGPYSTPVSAGSYTITLNATMGTLSHVDSIPLTVTSPSSGLGVFTSPFVIGGIIAAVVIIGIAAFALSRRSKK